MADLFYLDFLFFITLTTNSWFVGRLLVCDELHTCLSGAMPKVRRAAAVAAATAHPYQRV